MPKLVNRNAHGVRAGGQRLRAGQVKDVSGDAADALSSINGVETANSDDEKAWESYLNVKRGNPSGTDSGKASLDAQVAEVRRAGRLAGVALPLNQVVGDDDAPLGPPSGTITTKQAVKRDGTEQEQRAFGQRERQPEEADNEKLSPVERKQAEAKAALEEVHNEALEAASEAGNEAATPSKGKRQSGRKKQAEEPASGESS
jgi:uncharacterized protein YifE (UPF0438 family)